jgi:hypothetical protein
LRPWHVLGLGHNPFDGGDAGTGLDGKPIHNHQEHQFSLGTDDRMKAAAGLIEPLRGPEKPLNRGGRARRGIPPYRREQPPLPGPASA